MTASVNRACRRTLLCLVLTGGTVALLLALAPPATAAGAACAATPNGRPTPSPVLRYYLGADSAGAPGWLDEHADRTTAAQLTVQGATDGATNWAGDITANAAGVQTLAHAPARVRFESAPLDDTLYLNLSRNVYVHLAFTTSQPNPFPGAAPYFAEEIEIRLYAGGEEIGGDFLFRPLTASTHPSEGWFSFDFGFRPEADRVEAGTTLALEVLRHSQPHDFILGFAGETVRSTLTLHGLAPEERFDPNATVITHGAALAGGPASGGLDGAEATLASTAPPATGLLGWLVARQARRPMRRASAAAALGAVALLAVSGCLGGGGRRAATNETETTTDTPIILEHGKGAVAGRVVQDIGLAIPCAYVALLGTLLFTKADTKGRFELVNVTPGQYVLRVDHDRFESVEEMVEVRADRVTAHDVVLFPIGCRTAACREHPHHNWPPGVDEVTVYDSEAGDPKLRFPEPQGKLCLNNGVPIRVAFYPQDQVLPPRLVLPGADYLSVKIDWTPGSSGVDRVGFYYKASNSDATVDMAPKPPGSTTRVFLTPPMADSGHASYTAWTFGMYLPAEGSLYTPDGEVAQDCSQPEFRIRLTVHQGIVPVESAHEDWWGNKTEIALFPGAHHVYSTLGGVCTTCFQFAPSWATSVYSFRPADGLFVPPDTERLVIRLDWREAGPGGLDPAGEKFSLRFRTGAQNPATTGVAQLKQFRSTSLSANATQWELTFPQEAEDASAPTAHDLDAYYQKKTNWVFLVVVEGPAPWGDPQTKLTYQSHLDVWLAATAYRNLDARTSL